MSMTLLPYRNFPQKYLDIEKTKLSLFVLAFHDRFFIIKTNAADRWQNKFHVHDCEARRKLLVEILKN